MPEKFKILAQFIKDMSSETVDTKTYLFVKEYLKRYTLSIEISSKPQKNRLIEVNTQLIYKDKSESKNKAYLEINYMYIKKYIN